MSAFQEINDMHDPELAAELKVIANSNGEVGGFITRERWRAIIVECANRLSRSADVQVDAPTPPLVTVTYQRGVLAQPAEGARVKCDFARYEDLGNYFVDADGAIWRMIGYVEQPQVVFQRVDNPNVYSDNVVGCLSYQQMGFRRLVLQKREGEA